MLSIILGILGSGGFGSIVGLVGGYMNRKLDMQAKSLEIQDKVNERAHDLAKMDKEREFMKEEWNARVQVADKENEGKQIEGDAAVEVAGYDAMGKSYSFAAPTPADGWVDKASKLVRPLVTVLFLVFTFLIFWQVQRLVDQLATPLTPEQILKVYIMLIEWAIFQTGVCTGWWFAMRPGKHPKAG